MPTDTIAPTSQATAGATAGVAASQVAGFNPYIQENQNSVNQIPYMYNPQMSYMQLIQPNNGTQDQIQYQYINPYIDPLTQYTSPK